MTDLKKHLQDLVTRQDYALLEAVQIVASALESAAHVVDATFPGLEDARERRDLVIRVQADVLRTMEDLGGSTGGYDDGGLDDDE